MAKRRGLLVKVEKLLDSLLVEAGQQQAAVFDEDGVEKTPARAGVSFGERLRLAEVVTSYEVRRDKIEKDEAPSELDEMLEDFHDAHRAPARGRSRKTRAPESNGIANAGRTLAPYAPNIATDDE